MFTILDFDVLRESKIGLQSRIVKHLRDLHDLFDDSPADRGVWDLLFDLRYPSAAFHS